MIMLKLNIKIEQDYVTWIQIVLLLILKRKIFIEDISQDVNKRFDTSNYTFDRPLPTEINKKVKGLMKDELGGDIITEFVALRPTANFQIYPQVTTYHF